MKGGTFLSRRAFRPATISPNTVFGSGLAASSAIAGCFGLNAPDAGWHTNRGQPHVSWRAVALHTGPSASIAEAGLEIASILPGSKRPDDHAGRGRTPFLSSSRLGTWPRSQTPCAGFLKRYGPSERSALQAYRSGVMCSCSWPLHSGASMGSGSGPSLYDRERMLDSSDQHHHLLES